MEPEGTVALVTGAAAGTGRAIALRLGTLGAVVVVADIDADRGEHTVRMVEMRGGRAAFVSADVTNDADVQGMVVFADQGRGGPHILVNNAGGGGHVEPHFPDATPSQWSETLDLNLRSAMLATQLALDPMRTGGGGVVVNIASTGGLGFAAHQSPEYAAAKAGLIRFTASLAQLQERMNVRVNCVVPDWIATERAQDELARMTPDERAAAPVPVAMDEVADAVVECVRDDHLAGGVMILCGREPRRRLNPA
jgi:NAD(P)-dependent dehydrogenase (short-subunit alcohol dehydrogenase family)